MIKPWLGRGRTKYVFRRLRAQKYHSAVEVYSKKLQKVHNHRVGRL